MYYYNLIEDEQMNFTINRALTYDGEGADVEEVKAIAHKIKDFEDWYREMHILGNRAEKEKRYMHAAFYHRMSEFFLEDGKEEKEEAYQKFVENFDLAVGDKLERFDVPFEDSSLPVIRMKAENEIGVVLVHGGYDSFMEEFYLGVKDVIALGYTLIMFEGPGQGKTLRRGLKFTHEWEKPTSAVLDYFNLDEVTLIGISWGGYLAQRAAAYEKRIKHVIAFDVMYDGLDVITNQMPNFIKPIFRYLVRNNHKKLVLKLIETSRKKKLTIDWAISHGQYITGAQDPYEFFQLLSNHRLEDVGHLITQDVLLLAGEEDHLIPLNHLAKTQKILTNAKSVTSKLFTKETGGEQHCQTGEIHLAINAMLDWIQRHQ